MCIFVKLDKIDYQNVFLKKTLLCNQCRLLFNWKIQFLALCTSKVDHLNYEFSSEVCECSNCCSKPQGQYQNDLRGLLFDNQSPDLPKIPGEYVLEVFFQIDMNRSKWWNLSVLFSMIIIYRILFFIMIKINEDVTPWIRGYLARRRLRRKSDRTATLDRISRVPSLRTYVDNP